MTSKLTFRARTLDASKPMAIYNAEDLPELTELNAINRSVPAMPTGMEKEEESEKHLQDILELQNQGLDKKINLTDLYIPTPEVFSIDDVAQYTTLYKGEYKVPRQYIHVQPFSVDSETPDYDLDSEDEAFLETVLQKQKGLQVDLTAFEDMIDRLEKNSGHSVVSDKEAKLLLKGNDELILSVYDYWIDKRLRLKQSLIPIVKSDKRDLGISTAGGTGGSSAASNASTNPYIAFRRRTEKMQTRKNRKNDEASYEKMLKLRRDLSRAIILLDMIRRREKMKKENLSMTADIFEKRYLAGDFEGRVLAEVQAQKPVRLALQPSQYYANRYAESWLSKHHHVSSAATSGLASSQTGNEKAKRRDKKRKSHHHHSRTTNSAANVTLTSGILSQPSYFPIGNGPEFGTNYHSEEDRISAESSATEAEDDETEGPFVFRRQPNVQYLAPLSRLPFGGNFSDEDDPMEGGGWPWDPRSEGGGAEPRYRYSLASLSTPKARCIGFARRRVGRGGRYVLDRATTSYDDLWRSLDFTIIDGNKSGKLSGLKNGVEDDDDVVDMEDDQLDLDSCPHFRPVTPPHCRDDWDPDPYKFVLTAEASGLNLTQPIKPVGNVLSQPAPGFIRSNSLLQTPTRALGLRTVSVDSLGAQNAATAVVSTDMFEIFRPSK